MQVWFKLVLNGLPQGFMEIGREFISPCDSDPGILKPGPIGQTE